MQESTKPSFGRVGNFVDSDYLPIGLVRELRAIVARAKLSEEQTSCFLTSCAEWAQHFNDQRVNTPSLQTAISLGRVASEARRLLAAINSLEREAQDDIEAHVWSLSALSAPPVALSKTSKAMQSEGQFLGRAWDTVSDLKAVATYAAGQIELARGVQVSEANARCLVRLIASAFQRVAGRLPPYSRDTWFPEYMLKLAQWEGIKVPCGRALVESAIRELQAA